jgi:hypothetical protein
LWPGSLAAAGEDLLHGRDEDQCAAIRAEEEEGDSPPSTPSRRRETRRHPRRGGGRPVAVRTEEEGGRSAPWPLALLCGGRERGMRGERAEMSVVR